jgi:hypothetical protein
MGRGQRRAVAAALALAAAAVAAPRPAAAQPAPAAGKVQEEARERYRRGVRLYEEGDFQAALIEFRRAYETLPAFQAAYNIARAYQQLQNYAGALQWFERYVREGGRNVPPARADEVQREVVELRRRVALLEVTSDRVAGATVTVDDEPMGETPLAEPLRVSAGRRRVRVAKPGFVTFETTIDLAGNESRAVRAVLTQIPAAAPAPAAPAPAAPGPAPPRAESPFTALSWAGLGAAGALGVGALVTGVIAYNTGAEVHEDARQGPVSGAESDRFGRARRLATVADVLAGAGAVTAGVTLALTIGRGRQKNTMTSGVSAPPRVDLGLGGVRFTQSF